MISALVLVLVLTMGGCTVGPDYRAPKTEVPAEWSAPAPVQTGPLDISRWWGVFNDLELDSLIQRAMESNKDLKLAEARIREARAQRGVVASAAYPTVDVAASYSRSRTSEHGLSSTVNPIAGRDLFQFGFDAGWEIDIFGKVRRAVEASDADIQASEEDRRDVLVTLLAEVARNYLEVRGSQLQLSITRENLKAQEQTVQLTRDRFAVGLSSELNIAQAEAQLASTESQVPALENKERESIHQLGVLLGQEPGALLRELSRDAPLPVAPPEVPVGLPSDLLRRRPDIRRAERQLAASTARIGVATADLYPRFSLTSLSGMQAIAPTNLVVPESSFWSIGPTVKWPVFDAGRIRALIQVQDARQEQALVTYEKTVLTALKDTENALTAYSKEQVRRRSLAQAVEANRRAFVIAGELYARGLVDFLNVLESQRSLYVSQELLAQSELNITTDLVALYKALGGGWDTTGRDETMEKWSDGSKRACDSIEKHH